MAWEGIGKQDTGHIEEISRMISDSCFEKRKRLLSVWNLWDGNIHVLRNYVCVYYIRVRVLVSVDMNSSGISEHHSLAVSISSG